MQIAASEIWKVFLGNPGHYSEFIGAPWESFMGKLYDTVNREGSENLWVIL